MAILTGQKSYLKWQPLLISVGNLYMTPIVLSLLFPSVQAHNNFINLFENTEQEGNITVWEK